MKKQVIIILLSMFCLVGMSFKPTAQTTFKRCPEAGTRYCGDWYLIGTGPGGVLMYQRDCTLITAVGGTCWPVADPEVKEVAP